MRNIIQKVRILLFLMWLLLIGGPTYLPAEEVVLPQATKEALGNFARLKTLAVTWTEHLQLTAFGRGKLAVRNYTSRPETCYLVWQGGKMYVGKNDGGREWKSAPGTRRDEFAFDGQILAGGCPDQLNEDGRRRSPGLLRYVAAELNPDADYFGVKSFQPMGIHLPEGMGKLIRVKQLSSQVLNLLEHDGRLRAVGHSFLDGKPMIRVALVASNPVSRLVHKTDLAAIEQMLRDTKTMTEEERIFR